jgi:thiamine biosynthesis protein ThiS
MTRKPPHPELTVRVNGEPVQVAPGTTLRELLERIEEPYEHALVLLNDVFRRRDELARCRLQDGDEIEVILPAFGG